jgi:hypothetical protein
MRHYRKESLADQKLILLYALRKLGLSAGVPTLCDLTAGRNWMNYFDMRQHLLELAEAGFLKTDDSHERYALTGEGLSALELYKKRIPFSIRCQIDEYARQHGAAVVRNAEIHADFTQDSADEFPVSLSISENGVEIFRLRLVATTREEARALCNQFDVEGPQIYADLIHRLTRDPVGKTEDCSGM